MRYLMAALALTLASCGAKTDDHVLTPEGLGAVRIGMTVAQAEKALGVKFIARQEEFFEPGCWYTHPAGEQVSRAYYMVAGVVIVRIDVRGDAKAPSLHDAKGLGIGAEEKAVITAYGGHLENTPHPYLNETGRYLRIPEKDGKTALLFETDEGKVTSFRAGRIPFVDYIEGCS